MGAYIEFRIGKPFVRRWLDGYSAGKSMSESISQCLNLLSKFRLKVKGLSVFFSILVYWCTGAVCLVSCGVVH